MSTLMLVLVTGSGLYVGGNIGANDAANCIGASVGAGLMRYRTAILLVAVCVVAGALLQGSAVAKTVGKGIVTDPISNLGVLSALLSGGFFVTLATFFKVPVSTSQAVVGAVAGVGIAGDLTVKYSKIITIAECWVACPVLTLVLTFVIYRFIGVITRKVKSRRTVERVLMFMVVASAGYAAYSLGANNLGNAIGPILALGSRAFATVIPGPILWEGQGGFVYVLPLTVMGSLSIASGALLFGRGVAETVGKNIITLDLPSATAVQIAMAFGLHLFSMFGIPVSTSQAIVGALLGIGLAHGIKTVSKKKIMQVVAGWILAPTLSGLVSYGLYALLNHYFG